MKINVHQVVTLFKYSNNYSILKKLNTYRKKHKKLYIDAINEGRNLRIDKVVVAFLVTYSKLPVLSKG